ncbi:MAG: trypsin-like serine protease [Ruminococcaceae bacterium]|nr:trypsin-like serine protease [Oscillospiraceae bacterium]
MENNKFEFLHNDDPVMNTEKENTEASWFSDDFEEHFRRAVPKHRSLTVYMPKTSRVKTFFRKPAVAAIISSVLTCSLCFGIFAALYRPKASGNILPDAAPPITSGDQVTPMVSGNNAASIPQIYDAVSPAVVTILCQNQNGSYLQSQMSSGSGIILRQDGYIVTNNHVIEGASQITVNTIAGQSMKAELIGRDARTDLAVLKVKADQPLPYATLGDSSTLKVGDMALAIGNPLREELAGTLTVGYISAINRSMVIDGKQMTMLQTDAAINPGNSGGALLNMQGHVIGINTAKSTGYDVEGLGFAIPVNEAKPIIESIIENGYVTGRVVIGLVGQNVTEAIAQANNLPMGVYVTNIVADSAAAKAGLAIGDVIVACDGKAVKTVDEINAIRDSHKVGDSMTLTVYRNNKNIDIRLKLQEEKPSAELQAPQTEQVPQTPQQQIPFPFSWFGW